MTLQERKTAWAGRAAIAGILAAAGLAGAGTGPATAQTSAGTLQCETAGGFFHFGSTREVTCVFHAAGGRNEAYAGRIGDLRLGLRPAGAGVIVWNVVATHGPVPAGELAGSYAAAGRGTLVDGSDRTIALRVAPTGRTFNVAEGVGTLEIAPLMQAPAERTAHHRQIPAVGLSSATPGQHYGCGSYVHVAAGDTMSAIAHRCGVSLEALLKANPAIRDVRALQVGETVSVPGHVSHEGVSPCGTHITLHEGESIQEAAWRCGVTQHALLMANPPLRDLGGLHAGLVLALPPHGHAGGPVTIVADAPAEPVTFGADFADGLSGGPDVWHVVGVQAGHRLNLRAGPSTANPVVDRVGPNTALANKGCRIVRGERWCLVEEVDGSRITGWVAGRFLAEGANPASVHTTPVAAGPVMARERRQERRRAGPAARQAVARAQGTVPPARRIAFAAGATSATVEDALTGRDGIDYMIRAAAGQTMTVRLQSAGIAYFNILPPAGGPGDAIFVGSREGDSFEAELPTGGDYAIRVHLMGGDRDEGRTVPFRLTVSVTGAEGAAAGDTAMAEDRTERIRFAPGETFAVLDDAVTGSAIADYLVRAEAGQTMAVEFDAAGGAFFNILPPGSDDVAIFNGSTGEEAFEEVLAESGDYTVRVYLMGDDRDSGRTVDYRLEVVVTGAPADTGPAALEGDARDPETGFHATGTIPCTAAGIGDADCPFGVERRGNGSADVVITRPSGQTRIVFFEEGVAVGSDASEADSDGDFSARREGDETIVIIGSESYRIFDAVVFGG